MMAQKTHFYIQGIGNISPQKTFNNDAFLEEIVEYTDNVLTFVNPEYKEWINPVALRRMSRLLKAGLAAARIAAKDADLTNPDGIIAASGYGCIGDTSKFLHELLANDEKLLTPTFFMQSTYNTISGAIALAMNCNEYNTTYAHRGFAFENGLQDAMMQLSDFPQKRILVGAFDETNAEQYKIKQKDGFLREKQISNLSLFETEGAGTLQGEGATFFVLGTENTEKTYCKIADLKTVYNPNTTHDFEEKIITFLAENDLAISDIDILVNGIGGDTPKDTLTKEVVQLLFPETQQVVYKHLFGEHASSSALGVWLGAKILHHQRVPKAVKLNDKNINGLNTILAINHFWGKRYSMVLLRR
jgi:3-oxoacyl-[acyl-carrier-protein] synthase II